ncbi:DMT family transporter [Aestuariivivens sediminis]|uniref:DMT family transporter n=1 Tax=Aestuariivivens sediminis TaxID=2913557 RepID=UPI001F5AA4B8|nr:DMT family transporter [Aestuariivivens sediminis]
MIISALAFAMLNVGVKYLSAFNVYQIVFFRALGSLCFTFPFLIKRRISFIGNKVKLLMLRSVFGFIAMALFFSALQLLPTGTAISIRYLAPIFAAFFAVFILKEYIRPVQWLYFSLAFVGVVALKGFEFQSFGLGFLMAMASAILTGWVFVIIRQIGNHDHPMVIVNYFMLISCIISGLLGISYWQSPVGFEWLVLLSLGVFGFFGQIYMTKALQGSKTGFVAPLKYIEVVFTMIAGVILFAEQYSFLSLVGIALICASLILNSKY